MSADIEPTDVDGPHHQGDVTPLLTKRWDMVIAFPPCTDLSSANANMLKVKDEDGRMGDAAAFFMKCWAANSPRVCVENPVGVMSTLFRKPDQYIQPWEHGHPYRKKTGLWLRGLPLLQPTEVVDGRGDWHREAMHLSRKRRARVSAETFPGIAAAMAHQWASTTTDSGESPT